jgi:hypothetical protein
MPATRLFTRILLRLEQAELCEQNFHFRDDYRIAWITVLKAWRGSPEPHVLATYAVLGLHPDLVWDRVVDRRRKLLGVEYPVWYDERGNYRVEPLSMASSPRKPVQPERRLQARLEFGPKNGKRAA